MQLLRNPRHSRVAWTALAIAALGIAVMGYDHAHLFHEGYGDVSVTGPLFLLNGLAAAALIVLLLAGRTVLFCLGTIAVTLGAIVSILISHEATFFGFADAWSGPSYIAIISEAVALVAALIALPLLRRRTSHASQEATA